MNRNRRSVLLPSTDWFRPEFKASYLAAHTNDLKSFVYVAFEPTHHLLFLRVDLQHPLSLDAQNEPSFDGLTIISVAHVKLSHGLGLSPTGLE